MSPGLVLPNPLPMAANNPNKDNPTPSFDIEELKAFFAEETFITDFADEDWNFLAGLRESAEKVKDLPPISDQSYVKDGKTYYFVDFVQEGGGVLGIALVGFVYILEKAGIRFQKLGGTSAGAINTLALAAIGKPEDSKSEHLLGILNDMELAKFQDGPKAVVNSAQVLQGLFAWKPKIFGIKLSLSFWLGLVLAIPLVLCIIFPSFIAEIVLFFLLGLFILLSLFLGPALFTLRKYLGLHPGDYFEEWLSGIMKKHGAETTQKLQQKMNTFSPQVKEQYSPDPDDEDHVAVVASDLSNQIKTVFPRDAHYYYSKKELERLNPASFGRASMSVPLFFHPKTIKNIPRATADKLNWIFRLKPDPSLRKSQILKDKKIDLEDYVKNSGVKVPARALMVDGGLISNFPIDIFHAYDNVPRRPTFGVRLGGESEGERGKKPTLISLLTSSFDTARIARDNEFINSNPDFRKLVSQIQVGDVNWLNFNLPDEDKRSLFLNGAIAAADFLIGFDWEAYKALREQKRNELALNIFEGNIFELIQRALKERNLEAEESIEEMTARSVLPSARREVRQEEADLRQRLIRLGKKQMPFDFLWVEKSPEKDGANYEKQILKKIKRKGRWVEVESIATAEKKMEEYNFDLMFVVADDEEEFSTQGEAYKALFEKLGKEMMPRTLFYVQPEVMRSINLKQAPGIMANPSTLIHQALDILEKKLKEE